jgi:hypothetical protein
LSSEHLKDHGGCYLMGLSPVQTSYAAEERRGASDHTSANGYCPSFRGPYDASPQQRPTRPLAFGEAHTGLHAPVVGAIDIAFATR